MDAFTKSKPEKLLYIPCIIASRDSPDYLATIDIDPESKDFGKVIHRLYVPYVGDELHHTGWNACSRYFNDIFVFGNTGSFKYCQGRRI